MKRAVGRDWTKKHPYTIQLIEVGYCSDTRWQDKLQEKQTQHTELCKELRQALEQAGFVVEEHIIVLGTAGTVYKHDLKALKALGLTAKHASDLLTKLHIHAINKLQDVVISRRHLEHSRIGVG